MSFAELSPDLIKLLFQLNIFIIDAAVVGSIAYSQDILNLLKPANPRGFFDAFNTIMKYHPAVVMNISSWVNEDKDTLRNYILESILGKLSTALITDKDKSLLRSLPMWQVYNNTNSPSLGGNSDQYSLKYSPIEELSFVLPPSVADKALLSNKYIHLSSDDHEVN